MNKESYGRELFDCFFGLCNSLSEPIEKRTTSEMFTQNWPDISFMEPFRRLQRRLATFES
jgi:hypothetical protein